MAFSANPVSALILITGIAAAHFIKFVFLIENFYLIKLLPEPDAAKDSSLRLMPVGQVWQL